MGYDARSLLPGTADCSPLTAFAYIALWFVEMINLEFCRLLHIYSQLVKSVTPDNCTNEDYRYQIVFTMISPSHLMSMCGHSTKTQITRVQIAISAEAKVLHHDDGIHGMGIMNRDEWRSHWSYKWNTMMHVIRAKGDRSPAFIGTCYIHRVKRA